MDIDMKKLFKSHWPWMIVLVIMGISILAYTWNFYSHPISVDPGDWGALGDYLGGIANPLISTIALAFIVKAYYTQKEELKETKEALRDAAEHSRAAAEAQAELVAANKIQCRLVQKKMDISLLLAEIEVKQNRITFLHDALERGTEALNKGRGVVDVFADGFSLISGNHAVDNYRGQIIININKGNLEIDKLFEMTKSANLESELPMR
jgi:hypothetical protein